MTRRAQVDEHHFANLPSIPDAPRCQNLTLPRQISKPDTGAESQLSIAETPSIDWLSVTDCWQRGGPSIELVELSDRLRVDAPPGTPADAWPTFSLAGVSVIEKSAGRLNQGVRVEWSH
jgi:hypothetical protein